MATDGSPPARKSRRSVSHLFFWRLTGLFLGAVCLLFGAPAGAAQSDEWSAPEQLFETSGRASEVELVADAAGTVHAFWAYGAPGQEEEGDAQAIYYAGRRDGAWSSPGDVLVSPNGQVARTPSAAVDDEDTLHLVWSGGAALYYSRVYAPLAADAQAWLPPVTLAAGGASLEPAIAADGQGGLYVVWTQAEEGLLLARSEDGGDTWGPQPVIFEAEGNTELARWGRVAVDDAGRVHVVLTHTLREVADGARREDPNVLYYLRSEDGGETWAEPFSMADEPDFGEINVATHGAETVHVAWNGRVGKHGRYHRWSDDGGRSWRQRMAIVAPAPGEAAGTGGLTGFPVMAVDGTGVLHLVSALDDGDYYFHWDDGSWSSPELISPGLDGSGVTGEQRSLEEPSLAIGGGNRLHVAFHDGFERIWYVSKTLAAPAARTAPYATVTPVPQPTATPAPAQASVSATPTAAFDLDGDPPRRLGLVPLLLLLTVPSALVILTVMIVASRRR